MDCWAHEESLYISRKLGSAEGVVQVYKCWSFDLMGDHSFSLLGETVCSADIDPEIDWEHKDYLRLLDFLEVNSAMVNSCGHVILRSTAKSPHVGRPDGPTTYWRCFDLLPLHAFGLVKPVDTHGLTKFLIIGGDVNLSIPDKAIDVEGLEEWKVKYNNLDDDFKQLESELATLKETFDGVSDKKKLVSDIDDLKSSNKQIQPILTDDKVEQKSLKISSPLSDNDLSACQIENKAIEIEQDSLKDILTDCQTENKKLVYEIACKTSDNDQLQVLVSNKDREIKKLETEVSNLQTKVSDSVTKFFLNSRLEDERNKWSLLLAYECVSAWTHTNQSVKYYGLRSLNSIRYSVNLFEYERTGSFILSGTWIVYRKGVQVIVTCQDADTSSSLFWNRYKLEWEKDVEGETSGGRRLFAFMNMGNPTFYR